ncbi:flavin-dependent monooxygenase [Paraburkholderia sp. HP33-1]|uniref:flavin-dependent monooxygenase n=1 Tax=Paraburkholderia sp. HP33-1 TaxID=2883243 RepID=UPI001F3214B7|nr:flavin-dependent monooxygenase [Paraburkholderia sp. HP33-1]
MNKPLRLDQVGEASPTPEELVARARALIPTLRERAKLGESGRQIPPETIADFKEAGLFRVLQPKRWGGYEMHPNVFFDIVMALGEGDMSSAWVYSVVAVHPWQIACYDERAQQEVWGEDDSTLASSTYMPGGKATPVEGGFRFSGRWGYSSGSAHCKWVLLGGMILNPDGQPTQGTFLLPRSDYEIVDAWDTPGLRGTGSDDIVVNDVFVPDYRVMSGMGGFLCEHPGHAVNDGALYRLPYGQVFCRAVSTPAIGALQGMIDQMQETAKTRANLFGMRTTQDPIATLAIAEAQNEVDQLKLILQRNFDVLWSYAERRELPPVELRSQYRFQASLPPERVSIAAARLFKAVGGAAVYNKNPYGRIMNDIMVGRQHIANQFEIYGRGWGSVLMGQENKDYFL